MVGIPFRIFNVGDTYKILLNMMLKDQIGKTREVYVNDMLVKSKLATDHMTHLSKMFNIRREY